MYQESDTERERRLSHEARTVRLDTISHPWLTPKTDVSTVRVEVSIADADGRETCGFLLVNVPDFNVDGMSDDEALAKHPATLATDTANEWLDERVESKGWTYVSVDDAYSA